MVARCKVCGKTIDIKKVAALRGEYCSIRCSFNSDTKKMGIIAIVLFGIGLVTILIGLFIDLVKSSEYWEALAFAGGFGGGSIGIGIIFGIMSLVGYIIKKIDAKKETKKKYHCIYCKEEVVRPEDEGPIVCMNCGKKTPMCEICGERIMKEEEVYTLEPCGHIVHRSEIFGWLHKNRNCPTCEEKIDKIDVDMKE